MANPVRSGGNGGGWNNSSEPVGAARASVRECETKCRSGRYGHGRYNETSFYLVGEFDAESRKRIMGQFLGDHLPCMTMIYVVALASPALKVEVDAWACQEIVLG